MAALLGTAAMLACAHRPAAAPVPATIEALLLDQTSGTSALLQAVSAASENVVWVSGHRATWARSVDGGATWQAGAMTGRDSILEFRDVHAVSASIAYLLAAGPGGRSRIYKTTDAGATWQLQFLNRDSSAFFDCFAFWDPGTGIAVSDAVDGRMIVITTSDGGAHWERVPDAAIPPALPGEGAFAASGTCVVTAGRADAWFGTGANTGARVYHTPDRGRSWTVVASPVVSGRASGIAALAFVDGSNGFALGGRLSDPADRSDSAVALTHDGGRTWSLGSRPTFGGAVYGTAAAGAVVIAAGPGGWTSRPTAGSTGPGSAPRRTGASAWRRERWAGRSVRAAASRASSWFIIRRRSARWTACHARAMIRDHPRSPRMRIRYFALALTAVTAGTATTLAAQKPLRPTSAPRAPAPATAPTSVATAIKGPTTVIVYKSASCLCCGRWVDYMRANGFTVEVHDQDDLAAIKRTSGVPDAAASCHTAQVGGYVIEGHVPVASIRRMLRERPVIAGLAVPGMVTGSPGMEQGSQHPAYDVVAIGRDGRTSVYERH